MILHLQCIIEVLTQLIVLISKSTLSFRLATPVLITYTFLYKRIRQFTVLPESTNYLLIMIKTGIKYG